MGSRRKSTREVGTIPAGFGLTDGPAARLGEDGRVYVDRRAMEAAAEDFEHKTGRKPLPVELVKALQKAAAGRSEHKYFRRSSHQKLTELTLTGISNSGQADAGSSEILTGIPVDLSPPQLDISATFLRPKRRRYT